MRRFTAELRRAAAVIDVPGTPTSLRLEHAELVGETVRISWSFIDPEVLSEDGRPQRRRVRGSSDVRLPRGERQASAATAWAAAQLAAARCYKLRVDADWSPGEPHVPKVWTAEEAWDALVRHLRSSEGQVVTQGTEIRVVRRRSTTTYRINALEFARWLDEPDPSTDLETVPAAGPMVDGLPLWAVDELDEVTATAGPVIGLVDGKLVGLTPADHDEPPR